MTAIWAGMILSVALICGFVFMVGWFLASTYKAIARRLLRGR